MGNGIRNLVTCVTCRAVTCVTCSPSVRITDNKHVTKHIAAVSAACASSAAFVSWLGRHSSCTPTSLPHLLNAHPSSVTASSSTPVQAQALPATRLLRYGTRCRARGRECARRPACRLAWPLEIGFLLRYGLLPFSLAAASYTGGLLFLSVVAPLKLALRHASRTQVRVFRALLSIIELFYRARLALEHSSAHARTQTLTHSPCRRP